MSERTDFPGRTPSSVDRLIVQADQALRTVFGRPQTTGRPDPDAGLGSADLDEAARRHVAGLMRVDHSGEVCAQALYQGQALTARREDVRARLEEAAREENDHLAWCERRLDELGSHRSLFNPLWYAGSFAIGALAGLAGDRWSLGFLAETERQVVCHLDGHLAELPPADTKSRAILEQMREDEGRHATTAVDAGAADLPGTVKAVMTGVSRVMTAVAYRL
jgi:ubiquinone biosynthesis monooxygenase Coq7